jgi:hypothetical protein
VIPTPLIVKALRQPDVTISLGLADWDLLLRQARRANMMGHLYYLLKDSQLLEQVPRQPRDHLESSRVVLEGHIRAVRWEINLVRQALAKTGVPFILLKGAAYVMAKLPLARGRLFSDIDIMVPKDRLNEIEAALMLNGWVATHHDAYDQRYYRRWMHELPPMQHVKRLTVIDVHHAILPETAHVRPDPQKLRVAAEPLEGDENLRVLAPVDMVLHSAAHLFHEAELDHGLRDLADIDGLLRHFGNLPTFWVDITERAVELELTRTWFYALRYCARILHTPVPQWVMRAGGAGRPSCPMLALMDMLFMRALMPVHRSCADWLSGVARRMLYVRAHWLRMPPLLLVPHLFHKAFISQREE